MTVTIVHWETVALAVTPAATEIETETETETETKTDILGAWATAAGGFQEIRKGSGRVRARSNLHSRIQKQRGYIKR